MSAKSWRRLYRVACEFYWRTRGWSPDFIQRLAYRILTSAARRKFEATIEHRHRLEEHRLRNQIKRGFDAAIERGSLPMPTPETETLQSERIHDLAVEALTFARKIPTYFSHVDWDDLRVTNIRTVLSDEDAPWRVDIAEADSPQLCEFVRGFLLTRGFKAKVESRRLRPRMPGE